MVSIILGTQMKDRHFNISMSPAANSIILLHHYERV
jgi:hypothetical protein